MKKSKRKSLYSKHSDYVEVSFPTDALYADVCELAAEGLDMDGGDTLQLFRIDGTVVPNKDICGHPWTIGEYLRVQKRNAAQMKLGIGFVGSLMVRYYYKIIVKW